MRLLTADGSDLWLAYGMNVHPGGDVAATRDAIREVVLPLRERLDGTEPFGIALRLDAQATAGLHANPGEVAELRAFLDDHGLYPFTTNAFVFGAFHAEPVKAAVYAPIWGDPERLRYTTQSADVLAALVSPGDRVSISTAPGSWRAWGSGAEVDAAAAAGFAEAARHLRALHETTGVHVALALEPEPGCTIQTVEEAIHFFEGPLADALGADVDAAQHLGLCYDVCHQAVVHEDPIAGLRRLAEAGVPVVKVQASSALEVTDPSDDETRKAIALFDEPTWLHQVGARDADGEVLVADDLPRALEAGAVYAHMRPWRVHFHVPVFRDAAIGPLCTTRTVLDEALAVVARGGVTEHLEIETYTWDAIPEAERQAGTGFDLVEALQLEYEHVLDVLWANGVRYDPEEAS